MITIEYTINDELMNADDGYDAAVFFVGRTGTMTQRGLDQNKMNRK